MSKLRILTSAFTCCPPGEPGFTGGEDVLGWQLIRQIARFHQVWTITNAINRSSIEHRLAEQPVSNLRMCYVGLPGWLTPLMRFQGTHQLHYYLWQIRAYFAARKLHSEVRFDLFHHITYANDWMASFIGALLPVPYVRGPGGGAHRTPKGFEREYSLGGRFWEKVRSVGQWFFRHDPFFVAGQSRARAILVCNRESMANVPDKWSDKLGLFPVNGVSSQDLALAARKGTDNTQFQVLSAGSLIRVKGFGLAIKSFNAFLDKHPDASFWIIGSGPEEPRLRAMVREYRIEEKVHFVRWLRHNELLNKLAECDVFLFPSLRDGGGAVVVEAMAAGKPVLCLDAGGPGMHIIDECGIKITPHTPQRAVEELAEALERLYLDQELRLRLGKKARERAEGEYHWDQLGERLMQVYQHALGHGNVALP